MEIRNGEIVNLKDDPTGNIIYPITTSKALYVNGITLDNYLNNIESEINTIERTFTNKVNDIEENITNIVNDVEEDITNIENSLVDKTSAQTITGEKTFDADVNLTQNLILAGNLTNGTITTNIAKIVTEDENDQIITGKKSFAGNLDIIGEAPELIFRKSEIDGSAPAGATTNPIASIGVGNSNHGILVTKGKELKFRGLSGETTFNGISMNFASTGVIKPETATTIIDLGALATPFSKLFLKDGAHIEGITEIDGNLSISGDVIQQGKSYITHAEQIYTSNDLIHLREGAISGLTSTSYTGLIATKYDGENDGALVYDKNGIARVGDVAVQYETISKPATKADAAGYFYLDSEDNQYKLIKIDDISDDDYAAISEIFEFKLNVEETQAIATREESPISTGLAYWDEASLLFKTNNLNKINFGENKTYLTSNGSEVVNLVDNQTISGTKKFTTSPKLANEVSLIGTTTDNYDKNLIKINASNDIVLGDQSIYAIYAMTHIQPTSARSNIDLGSNIRKFQDIYLSNSIKLKPDSINGCTMKYNTTTKALEFIFEE